MPKWVLALIVAALCIGAWSKMSAERPAYKHVYSGPTKEYTYEDGTGEHTISVELNRLR